MTINTNLVNTLTALDIEIANNKDNYSVWITSNSEHYSDLVYEVGQDVADSIVEYMVYVYSPF